MKHYKVINTIINYLMEKNLQQETLPEGANEFYENAT